MAATIARDHDRHDAVDGCSTSAAATAGSVGWWRRGSRTARASTCPARRPPARERVPCVFRGLAEPVGVPADRVEALVATVLHGATPR
nr:hypothetical protein [Saccharothrix sp. 6-C]